MINWTLILLIATTVVAAIGFELVEGTAFGVAAVMATILLISSIIITFLGKRKSS